jgi:hypothetical protein
LPFVKIYGENRPIEPVDDLASHCGLRPACRAVIINRVIPNGDDMPKQTEALRKYRKKANPQATDDPIRIAWETEMVQGYLDGRKADNPAPSGSRSHSYRHGFANGRDDLARCPRATAAVLRELAEGAIDKDIEASPSHNWQ